MIKDDINKESLPYSIEAERAVLGAVLRGADAMLNVAEILLPEHFFFDYHQKIYDTMLDLYKNNQGIDTVTLLTSIQKKYSQKDSDYFSPTYFVQLMEDCPISTNIVYYAQIVRNNFFLRKVIYTCHDTIKRAQSSTDSVEQFVEVVEKDFLEISKTHDRKGIITGDKVLESTIEYIQANIEKQGDITGVPSGFFELDQLMGGWQPSDLVIIAARPGMGKTAFALNCLSNAMDSGKKVVIFTLEMTKEQLMSRVLSSVARVDSARLRRGDLTDDETDRLMEGARRIHGQNAFFGIDETPGLGIMELRSRCRRYQKEHGLDMVIVDYLQLMGGSGGKKEQNREREISEISMGLKNLAKELNVPVISLSQLNRGPDARPDKRPRMSDLRESGSIEQDADMVFFIYRDEVYNPNSERAGVAELIIGKNRHGSTKTIDLAFQPNFVAFQNLMQPLQT